VGEDIGQSLVLSAVTSTRALRRSTIEGSAENPRQAAKSQNHTFDEARIVMNTLVGQRLWKWKLMAGVLTIVLGAIVLAWPGSTILVASTLFGVYLLVSGLAELFMAFTLPRSAATRVLLFISGALSVVLAILSFRHFGDAYAVLLLSLWIGIGFIFQGVSEVAVGISDSDLPARGWYVVAGIISVLAGLVVLVWPFDSIAVLTLAVGIWLVIIGITQIVQALQTHKHAKTAHHTIDEMSQHLASR
jgi:uncharacterized membrane protein HdeD (DUF308 family)